ncbi:MFS transporter [Bosea sp. 2RAB26]|uniref:MFS transporter n=1 Tax=Bosea sp. 2RAB26 TaxID=3237476 RepID=UPI003F921D96
MSVAALNGQSALRNKDRTKVALSCFLGSAIEWYDFMLYGFLAPLVFDKLFFPHADPVAGMIAVLGIFAVGFVARPLGGLFFGHFGDRLGRKPVMAATLILMGLSTTAIGLLPTYDSIGIWAAGFLLALRFLQGFALGGESTGAPVLMLESAPEGKRGVFASIAQSGNFAGVVIATLVVSFAAALPSDVLLTWGWRVPFLLSIVLVGLGFYVRLKVEESPVFEATRTPPARVPLLQVLDNYKRPALIVFCCALAESGVFYLTSIFGLSYGVKTLGIDQATLLRGVLLGNVIAIAMVPLFGALSDRIGRRLVLGTGFVLAGLYVAFLFFPLLQTRDTLLVVLAMAIPGALIQPMHIGVTSSFYPELFPDTRVRFSGVSLGRQFGTIFGGGAMPVIAASLLAWSGGSLLPILMYFSLVSVIAIGAVMAAEETRLRAI